ncbi:hypothetical protein ACXX9E_28555 [Pseudomonas sp. GNP014]
MIINATAVAVAETGTDRSGPQFERPISYDDGFSAAPAILDVLRHRSTLIGTSCRSTIRRSIGAVRGVFGDAYCWRSRSWTSRKGLRKTAEVRGRG